jgi:S-(hydroxymethyl)mycothiol dehydrogenase
VTHGVLLNEPGERPVLEELELEPPGPGEVEVRIEASGVCHSDLHVLETGGWGLRFPILLGHEGAGRVERVGEGVERPRPAEYVVLGCAVATGVGAVRNTSPVWPGARVAVLGCGGVGLSAIQGARIAGAAAIVAVDVVPEKLEWAGRLGATELVDTREEQALAGVEPVDFAYEAAGLPQTLEQAVRLLGHGGTATMIGLPRPGARISLELERDLFDRRATLRVSYGGDHLPAEDFPLLARLALDGELDLASLVTRTIGLGDVEDAFADLVRGNGIRSVVRFT